MCLWTGGDKSNSFNISTTVSLYWQVQVYQLLNMAIEVLHQSGSTDLLNAICIPTRSVEETSTHLKTQGLFFKCD